MNARVGQSLITTVKSMGKPAGMQIRSMVLKPPTRAAVHGVRLPTIDTLEKDEAELEKAKQEKRKKIEDAEQKVDSQLGNSDEFISPLK